MARIAPRTLSCGTAAAGRCAATARGAMSVTKNSSATRRIEPPWEGVPGNVADDAANASIVAVMRRVVLPLYVLVAGCQRGGGATLGTRIITKRRLTVFPLRDSTRTTVTPGRGMNMRRVENVLALGLALVPA